MRATAVIIAFNEARKIGGAINSVSWADEVLVVDSESTDETRQIAADLGARVIVQPWLGFSKQKQFAVDSAENDWIFSLDADERVSAELRSEILALIGTGTTADGYRIPRLAYYMDRPIHHSGWYPDKQLRFFDRRKARWNKRMVHESVEMDPGSIVGDIKGDLIHYSIDDPEHHHKMIGERYAPLAAEQMFQSGKRTTRIATAIAGPAAFLRAYVLKAGFLDGFPGFCIAKFAAHHAFLKHLLLLQIQRDRADK